MPIDKENAVVSTPSADDNLSQGIMTIAHGAQKYVDMAKALGLSLKRTNPDVPRALVTDSKDPELLALYDIHIPHRPEFGNGLRQKLYLDVYTPFRHTLFIDSDCLVIKDVSHIWKLFAGHSVGVVGSAVTEGYWFGNIAEMLKTIGAKELPKFNGGIYYIEKGEKSQQVCEVARDVLANYEAYGCKPLKGGPNDEVAYALAMGKVGVPAVQDAGNTMRTPIGIRGWFGVDSLSGYCRFVKRGVVVEPAIVHFAGRYAHSAFYFREVEKLTSAEGSQVGEQQLSRSIDRKWLLACLKETVYFGIVEVGRYGRDVIRLQKVRSGKGAKA